MDIRTAIHSSLGKIRRLFLARQLANDEKERVDPPKQHQEHIEHPSDMEKRAAHSTGSAPARFRLLEPGDAQDDFDGPKTLHSSTGYAHTHTL